MNRNISIMNSTGKESIVAMRVCVKCMQSAESSSAHREAHSVEPSSVLASR